MQSQENNLELPIIWCDESIIVINKPAPLLTIQDGYRPELPNLKNMLSNLMGPVWVVHRLDQNTSGVIVFARNPQAHRKLNIQFENRQVKKKYQAVVAGSPAWENLFVDLPLLVNGDRKHRTKVDHQQGKSASTVLDVIHRAKEISLIEATPYNGYTHQIRAHLAACGHPILNDTLYSNKEQRGINFACITRIALHALEISFTHPAKNEVITFRASYPPDFQQAINDLF